jgi:hypothetical protein
MLVATALVFFMVPGLAPTCTQSMKRLSQTVDQFSGSGQTLSGMMGTRNLNAYGADVSRAGGFEEES